ncbi:MAG: hypothetical protein K2O24_05560 [Muribaculaceae bacterium]|nr:hypothetical protein [Muribaculaceae bacterium]
MTRLIIILIIAALLWWLWPRIRRAVTMWIVRRLQRNAEDYVRRAAGMPPRDGKDPREGRRQSREAGTRRRRAGHRGGPLIPKEYAVDVEYVEIHDYSSTTVIGDDGARKKTEEWHESQVTDAEWVEIRDRRE